MFYYNACYFIVQYSPNNSLLRIVATLDNENNITTVLNKIKDIKKYSSDVDAFTKRIKILKDAGVKAGMPINSLMKEFGHLNKSILDAGESCLQGTTNFDKFAKVANDTKSTFSGLALTLKNVALNAGIMLAVTIGIKAVTAAWDYFNNTVEEQEEKINNLKSSYEGLKSEYDALSQKQDLTDAEKRRLEYLERRLELDQKILEAEEKMLFEEKYGNKFTDWFDKDNQNVKYSSENNMYNYDGYARQKHNYDSDLNQINKTQQQIELYEKRQAQLTKGSNAYLELENRILNLREKEKKQIEDISKQENQLTVNLGKYADEIESIEQDLKNPNLTGEDKVAAQEQLKAWQAMYDETEAMITNIQKLNGTYKDTENIIENISNNKDSSNVEFLGISETVAQINSTLKPAIDSLNEAYNDIFTEDGFTRENIGLDMINSIQKELDELSEAEINIDSSSLDNLIEVLNDTESSAEEIKDAFDEVAYSIASASLSGLEDFETLKNSLKELGYVDFEMTAFESLLRNKEALKSAGLDLANATELELVAFSRQIVSAENASQAYHMLRYAKELNNLQTMDTSSEVANLKNLAENAGYTGNVIAYLTELEQIYQDVASGKFMGERLRIAQSRAEELKSLIEAESSKINFAPKANTQDWKPVIDSAGKAGKDAAEEYKEALENELSDLDTVLGFITDTIQDQIDLWNDQKDAAVDSLTAQKEAAEEALEAEKELIQAQIDAIQEKIDAKQDEIDAIQDARKEREANIDLMKKEYELQRLQNQNTQLVYKNGQMVYENDSKGVFDAREAVDEAKENLQIIAIEKEITDLENEIEDLEKVIDSIDKQIEASNKHFDKLIEQTEKYYDNLIKGMEEYKSRWEEIGEIEEQAKINVLLQELGITTDDVLNMSGEAFEQFKKRYLDILTEMHKGESDMVTAINEVADGIDTEKLSEGLGKTKENIDKLSNTDYSTVVNGVGGISSALNEIPSSEKYDSLTNSFNLLAEAIQNVAIALGITGDESVSGLVDALQTLSEFSFGDAEGGVIAQFTSLKDAIDSVTSAITGGGSKANEGGGLATGANGGAATPTDGGGVGGLTSAISEIGTTTEETLGSGGESSEKGSDSESGDEGVIGKFSEFKSAVDDVIKIIGTDDEESSEDSITLISALRKHYEVANDTVPKVTELFDELYNKISDCVTKLGELAAGMASLGGGSWSMMGTVSIYPNAKGTVGNAFAKGYNGLPHREKNALRSEYGQPELTVYPDGTTELTTKPIMSDLPKDTVIFNEEQTRRIMNGKGTILGKAFANGTTINPALTIQDINGKYLHDSFLNKLDDIILPINSINKNVESMFRMSSNIHNSNSMQPINLSIGDIQVHGVQDVNGLANAIANQLPNTLLQTMTKRK